MIAERSLLDQLKSNVNPDADTKLTSLPYHLEPFYLSMLANGYTPNLSGNWSYSLSNGDRMHRAFKGQEVSFFGPNAHDLNPVNTYFGPNISRSHHAIKSLWTPVFSQPSVQDVISQYAVNDPDQALKIAFVLGGIVRLGDASSSHIFGSSRDIYQRVDFIARMTKLAGPKSGLATASAMARYALEGASLITPDTFKNDVKTMAESIDNDPVIVRSTPDMGVSQLARLKSFQDQMFHGQRLPFPDISPELKQFDYFPTTGAEFHFELPDEKSKDSFWQKIALLNMSQYQEGSQIQLSRNDQGVAEVRMNPSFYPVTIETWKKMLLIMPELKGTYFQSTFNRQSGDFSSLNPQDVNLVHKLRALGSLIFAAYYKRMPSTIKKAEIPFGSTYLGQSVKLNESKGFRVVGDWSGGSGIAGQVSVYTGYGENLPSLAYYLSCGIADPELFKGHEEIEIASNHGIQGAFRISSDARKALFINFSKKAESSPRLAPAIIAGNQLLK